MVAARVSAIVLAAGITFSPWLHAGAQAVPDINLPAGDAARGKAIFEGSKGNCGSCHRVNGAGSLFGPDLSAIGAPRGGGGGGAQRGAGGGAAPAAAARGVATPAPVGGGAANPPIPPVPAAGGGAGAGRGGPAANQGGAPTPQQLAQSIQDPNAVVSPQNRYVVLKMKDGKTTITGKLLSVDTFAVQIFDSAEKLRNISKDNVREMTMTSPMPSYRDKFTTQELADVISYLTSLKGQ